MTRLVPAEPIRVLGTPSQDPKSCASHGHLIETAGSLVRIVFLALIPITPTSFVYAGHLNDGGSFLNSGLWGVWLPICYGFLVVFAATEVWKTHAPRLTTNLRLAGLGVTFVFGVFLSSAILTQDIVDPAILDDAA